MSYVDDFVVGGASVKDHDDRLYSLLQVLHRYGFRLNLTKIQTAVERVRLLGINLFHGTYSLKSFILSQQQALPQARTLREVRKLLGLFNFVRGFVPRLDALLLPLQEQLSKPLSQRKSLGELQDICSSIWHYILLHNLDLSVFEACVDAIWTLSVDWSPSGMGYVLFRGPIECRRVVSIGSRSLGEHLSSHLGELLAVKWSLQQVKDITAGQKAVLLSDSASVVSRLLREPRSQDAEDVRQARLYAWIWANYPIGTRLEPKHCPGDYNVLADLLSRWTHEEVS